MNHRSIHAALVRSTQDAFGQPLFEFPKLFQHKVRYVQQDFEDARFAALTGDGYASLETHSDRGETVVLPDSRRR